MFNAKENSPNHENSHVTILSADNREENIVIEIHKKGIEEDKSSAHLCDSGEPSDEVMDEEKPKAEPSAKGKHEAKSTVAKLEATEAEEVQELDNLKPTDDVIQIYKVYWSRKHSQIVAKIQLKRASKMGVDLGRSRQFGDVLAKIPIKQLKDRKSEIFIDFMSELIQDEIRR